MADQSRHSEGRYARVNDALPPGPKLPSEIPQAKIRVAAVPDPNRALGERLKRQKAAVNIHVDVLEMLHAYGRISVGAYQAGRTYQAVLELARGRRMANGEGTGGGSSASAHEWAIISMLESAQAAVDLIHDTRKELGLYAETLLTLVLGDGLTLTQLTEALGFSSTTARRRVSGEFQEALEDLARYWGRRRAPRTP